MKNIVMLMLILSISSSVSAMDYIRSINPWNTYVEWRYKNIIDSLAENENMQACQEAKTEVAGDINISRGKIPCELAVEEDINSQIKENYENELKPWYVKTLSYVPFLGSQESEESVLKRMYPQLQEAFLDAFYPRQVSKDGKILLKIREPFAYFVDLGTENFQAIHNIESVLKKSAITKAEYDEIIQKDLPPLIDRLRKNSTIVTTYEGGDTSVGSYRDQDKNKVIVSEAELVSDQDRARLDILEKKLKEIDEMLKNENRFSPVERWHRNKVSNRIKAYFGITK